MRITWLGTASIRIEAAGESILFDPFVQLQGGENPNSLEDFSKDETIFITHGHLDHLMEAPEFLDGESDLEATVFCGSVAAATLGMAVLDTSNVVEVKPGDSIRIGEMTVKVYEGKHADPGPVQKFTRLLSVRMLRHFKNALALAYLNAHYKEAGQTLIYEVQAEGKTILVMGSLGLADTVEYPVGADLLLLPFQGSRRLEETALSIVERLKPGRIILDHFDDAFPPISRQIDTRFFKKLMDEKHPEISVVKPAFGKAVEL
ncbi:MAG: MBL fold metallo-hydrolase [Lachnospiraceae bacterium]|nr:MBL fold metallo-hydrolase [Lachnospiraceae bacterium]